MRQKVRRIIIFIMLFLFPVTINYLSPYLSVSAAMEGLVAGSVLVFALMFLTGLFFGRAWCAWVCPMAGLSEICMTISRKPAPVRRLKILRYCIFALWFMVLILGFVLSGGIRRVEPLYMTEKVISIDEPMKYIIYYIVLAAFFLLSVTVGKRGACHAVCWMSPFLVGGSKLEKLLGLPQLQITANAADCVGCGRCDKSCQMGIQVGKLVKTGVIGSADCILCCECADGCPQRVLKPRMVSRKNAEAFYEQV